MSVRMELEKKKQENLGLEKEILRIKETMEEKAREILRLED